MSLRKVVAALFAILCLTISSSNAEDINMTKKDITIDENTLYLDLKDGRVVIQMRPDLAPKHVARIKELVNTGFYDGLTFHRVIDGFMAQTGDPEGNGTGGSGQYLPAEFSKAKHIRGTVSMARASDVNSADSQFFICLDDPSWLNGQYTVWGEVVDGMEYVDMIKKGDSRDNGAVSSPDKIVKMSMAKQ
ncbi:MAG: peptidylprolyl isomerase [Alphaproteobacteria bacterium]|nr:peptidylprolyl isomerase [Alphaproteobacteria bacterium]